MSGINPIGFRWVSVNPRQLRFASQEPPPSKPAEKPVPPKEAPKSEPGFFQRWAETIMDTVDAMLLRDPQNVMSQYIVKDLKEQIAGTSPITWQIDHYEYRSGKPLAYSFVNPSLPPRLKESVLQKLKVLGKDDNGKTVFNPLRVTIFRTHQGSLPLEVHNQLIASPESTSFFPFGAAADAKWIFNQLQHLASSGKLTETAKAKESLANEAKNQRYQAARVALVELLAEKATIEKKEVLTGESVRYSGQTQFTLAPLSLPENISTVLGLPTDKPVSFTVLQNSWMVSYEGQSLGSPLNSDLNPQWGWWNSVSGARPEDIAFSKLIEKLKRFQG